MKTKIILLCLLSYAFCLFSCSSGSEKKEEAKTTNDSTTSKDVVGSERTGLIEKNPPVINGEYVTKYSSGIVKMRGFYIKGKRDGQWTSFFENGKMQSEGFFKEGLRDGKAVVYYENGQIYYTGYYKDGKEIGKWLFYNEQGKQVNQKDYGDMPNS